MSSEWGVAVSVVAALISLTACVYSVRSSRTQTKVADFNSCLAVVERLAAAQRYIRDAKDAETKQFELRELLNLLEALAKLVNGGKVPSSTSEYVESWLEESWAYLRAEASVVELIRGSITGDGTYAELLAFAEKRRPRIEALTKAYQNQGAPGSDEAR